MMHKCKEKHKNAGALVNKQNNTVNTHPSINGLLLSLQCRDHFTIWSRPTVKLLVIFQTSCMPGIITLS